MKTDIKIDGVMVLTGVAIIAAVVVAYKVKKTIGDVGQKISDIVDIPVHTFNFVNDAVPPSISFDQKQADGTVKKVTVSGADIKRANANGANMGMIAWPTTTLPDVSPSGGRNWWDGLGYTLTDAEKENPFADPVPDTGTWLYTADSPMGKAVDFIGSIFNGWKYSDIAGPDFVDGGKGGW